MSLIKINNQYIAIKEFNNQRVVTFKDIDLLHQRTDGIARKNFNNNIQHFIEDTDYFSIKPSDVNNFPIPINNAGLTLITESGYLMLVKSFQDDLAWKVQRELVNSYFRVSKDKPQCVEDLIIMQAQSLKDIRLQLQETRQETTAVKQEVQNIKEVITIKPSEEWRKKTNILVNRICMKTKDYKNTKDEIYKALQERAGCDLKIRLKNMRGRLLLNGATQSKADNMNYLDVIVEDKKLIEIYVAIVKELAVKNSIDVGEVV